MSEKKKVLYESYNAMARPALFWGIPILPMLALFSLGLICGVVGATIFSFIWGLVFALPFVIALIALRLMTSIDDRYIRRMGFMLRRIWLNLKYGKQLLLTPYNPNWSQFYGKRFSQQHNASRGKGAVDGLSRSRAHGHAARAQVTESDQAKGNFSRNEK